MLLKNPAHFINGHSMTKDYPAGSEQMTLGMGCFWGAERIFWKIPGVHVTSVGYGGGPDMLADYKQVCTGRTGHAELVHVVFDPNTVSYNALLKVFFENHNPTQGNRQGNDVGSQYRSALYTHSEAQREQALAARDLYNAAYAAKGFGPITTEIKPASTYFYAEDYHQQYLEKNPNGYCGIGGTGVVCPLPTQVNA